MPCIVSSSTCVGLGIDLDAGNSAEEFAWQASALPRERTWRKVHNTFLEFYTTAGEEEGHCVGRMVRSISMDSAPAARRVGTQSLEAETQQLEQQMLTRQQSTMATTADKEQEHLRLQGPSTGGLLGPTDCSEWPSTDDEETSLCSDVNGRSSTSMSSTGEQPEMACAEWGFPMVPDHTAAGNWQQCFFTTGPVQFEPSQKDICLDDLTVMIRNICCSYTKTQIGAILDESGMARTYNFIRLPPSRIRLQKSNRGYVFVGFKNPEFAKRCWELFSGKMFGKSRTEKLCEVSWADHQEKVPLFARRNIYRQGRHAVRARAAVQGWAAVPWAPAEDYVPR